MPRYKLTVEYDGGPYVGFQRQENGPTVQQHLEEAAAAFCGHAVTVHGAGRTDTGVHATGQVVHIDLEKDWKADRVMAAMNAHLRPEPIAIVSSSEVDENFHARFSATGRAYLYRICDRRAPLALERRRAWHVPQELNAEAMHMAAQVLVGEHDFTTFRATQCQARSPVKTLDRLDVSRIGAEIHVVAEARSFLHHQVRSMVGCLQLVGLGKWSAADLQTALDAKDRAALGFNAPPEGLYLTSVSYDTQ